MALDLLNTQWIENGALQDALLTLEGTREWLIECQLWNDDMPLAPARQQLLQVRQAIRAFLQGDTTTHRETLNAQLRAGHWQAQFDLDGPSLQLIVSADQRPAYLAVYNLFELRRDAPQRIKQCAASDCILYFFDTSPKNARRWHDMKTCGNRVKAARHYRRRHPAAHKDD
nr:CGNR zinc finger domain-containing protein [Deinococcus betulae]